MPQRTPGTDSTLAPGLHSEGRGEGVERKEEGREAPLSDTKDCLEREGLRR